MGSSRALGTLLLVAALPFAIGACTPGSAASPSPAATPSPASAATTVEVKLQEWAVGTDVTSAPAGSLTFAVTNAGPADMHEFVVIKTDLSLIALPTDATGAVDEAGGGMEVIGEIEDVAVGASEELNVTLAPGAYVLICNIYDDTEKEAHYQMGMRTSFTVTQ
jgi:uncharacterized cupredoxin-like copper-binding protein